MRPGAPLETEIGHIKVAITPYFCKSEGRLGAAPTLPPMKRKFLDDKQTVSRSSCRCPSRRRADGAAGFPGAGRRPTSDQGRSKCLGGRPEGHERRRQCDRNG